MNRKMRRASEKVGKRLQSKEWNNFEDITVQAIVKNKMINPSSTFRPDKVYHNNKYIVQIFHNVKRNGRYFTKAMIRRNDNQAIYSWQDIFRIKNEIFGVEVEAIQFFPKKSELIDEANMYWLFVENI